MAEANEVAARIMEHLCAHSVHGYSQGSNRWGNGQVETLNIDGKTYSFYGGDRDCSSAVISAYEAAGIPVQSQGATYTGNMKSVFVNSGYFEVMPMSYIAQRGDVYLNEQNHTAMCVSSVPDKLAEFCINENGQITGGLEGDQTGVESQIRSYYDFGPWDCILRFKGGTGVSKPNHSSKVPDLKYRALCASSWLPEVTNMNDYAGVYGCLMKYLAIDMSGWYRVKTQKSGWLPPVRGYNVNDLDQGCAGDGSPITAVQCYYETQKPSETGWLKIRYQVHDSVNNCWLPVMNDLTCSVGSSDNFAGNGNPIDGFRAMLVK